MKTRNKLKCLHTDVLFIFYLGTFQRQTEVISLESILMKKHCNEQKYFGKTVYEKNYMWKNMICGGGDIVMDNYLLVILDFGNQKSDSDMLGLMRRSNKTFISGFYYNRTDRDHIDCCVWYIVEDVFGEYELYNTIHGHYKALRLDGTGFECNCADTDLPMVEDVWENIKNRWADREGTSRI